MTTEAISPQPRGKRKKLSKKIKWGIMLGIFSIPFIIFGLGSIDASPDDYSAVTPPERSAPLDEENILYHMNQMTELTSSTHSWLDKLYSDERALYNRDSYDGLPEDSPFHPDHQWDQLYWDQVILDHEEDLKHLRAAFAAPYYYDEIIYDIGFSQPKTIAFIQKNKINKVLLLNYIYNEKWEKSINIIKLQHEFINKIIEGAVTITEVSVASAISKDTLDVINLMLERSDTPSKIVRDCIGLLKNSITPSMVSQLPLLIKHEFELGKQEILSDKGLREWFGDEEQFWKSTPYSVHKYRMVNKLAKYTELYLKSIELSPLDFRAECLKLRRKYEDELGSVNSSLQKLLPNGTGAKLLSYIINTRSYIDIMYKPQIYSQLYMLKAAARLYQQEHGDLPNTIDELYSYIGGPVYDPMQSPKTPYRYSKKDAKAWSIGTNFVDDGGPKNSFIDGEDLYDEKDLSISLAHPSVK